MGDRRWTMGGVGQGFSLAVAVARLQQARFFPDKRGGYRKTAQVNLCATK